MFPRVLLQGSIHSSGCYFSTKHKLIFFLWQEYKPYSPQFKIQSTDTRLDNHFVSKQRCRNRWDWQSWNGASALVWTVKGGNKGEGDDRLGAVYWAGPPGAQRINLSLTRGANHNFKASQRPISLRPRGQTSRQPSPGGVPTGLIRNGCSASVRHAGREGFDQHRRRRRPALRCIAPGRTGPAPPQKKEMLSGRRSAASLVTEQLSRDYTSSWRVSQRASFLCAWRLMLWVTPFSEE